MYQVIHIRREAPSKPEPGEPCNGCGICCLSEPCPIGAVLSWRRQGACDALRWSEVDEMYRCGLLYEPAAHLPSRLSATAPLLARVARRFIAAGVGCDCELQVSAGRTD